MKRFFTLLIVMSSYQMSFGQVYFPLVDTGKTWSTFHDYCKGKWYTFSEYTKISGDTLLDGIQYKKVWNSADSLGTVWALNSFIREDQQRQVFLRNTYTSEEHLLYNFNLQVGDLLVLQYPEDTYRVDSIFLTTLLNGEQRREFILQDSAYNCTDTWIEGIGSLRGVLNSGYCGIVGDSPKLVCFTEHDTTKYHDPSYEKCYIITGTSHIPETIQFNVFPNPARETMTIESNGPNDDNLSFEVYNLLGKLLLNVPLSHQKTVIYLKNTFLSPGVFVYRVMNDSSLVTSGKLSIL